MQYFDPSTSLRLHAYRVRNAELRAAQLVAARSATTDRIGPGADRARPETV